MALIWASVQILNLHKWVCLVKLRWLVRQSQVKVLWICYSATISQYLLSGKASLGIAVLSLWKWRLYSNWSVKVSLLRPFFNIPSSEGYSFLYSTRSLKVQLINSNWRTVSVSSAWLIAKERISGSLDLPNGFQYAYTVSLYTHDSSCHVIDDSTIGGRWKTRLSESLPGWH